MGPCIRANTSLMALQGALVLKLLSRGKSLLSTHLLNVFHNFSSNRMDPLMAVNKQMQEVVMQRALHVSMKPEESPNILRALGVYMLNGRISLVFNYVDTLPFSVRNGWASSTLMQ